MLLRRISHPFRLALALSLLVLVALAGAWLTLRHVDLPRRIRITSTAELQRVFVAFDYSLAAARREGRVPRLTVSDVPEIREEKLDPADRKRVFFETVLPLVLIANERIAGDRQRLLAIAARFGRDATIGAFDRRWIAGLAERYRVAWPAPGSPARMQAAIAELRRRVGLVPPSLALSQAAVESAYGTSRFAIEGNALFGQWTNADGLTPERQRASKAGWSVATFATPLRSVEAYLWNLNTHRAYRGFRTARQQAEDVGGTLSGPALAPTLAAYSEKGQVYTETLQAIIQTNGLAPLDRATLDGGRAIRLIVP
jgi:Bax protein